MLRAAEADAPAGGVHEIGPDLGYIRLAIVNLVFVGPPGAGDRGWVLVDAGLPLTRTLIEKAAAARFGAGARPAAIVMTHGHFDHVGVLEQLARQWDVPVYAHPLERPYLEGIAAYPAADPSVGGGLMALLSPLYPTAPVNVCAPCRRMVACRRCRAGAGSIRRVTPPAMYPSGARPTARSSSATPL